MVESEVIRVLLEFKDILNQSDIFDFIVRNIGWGLIKLLRMLVNSTQGVLNKVMDTINFFDTEIVNGLINTFKPLIWMFLAISIMYIGYQIILNKKFDKSKIPLNFLIAILVVIMLPMAMNTINKMTKEGLKIFTNENSMLADQIIDTNVKDLYLYDLNNFSKHNLNPINNLSEKNISTISAVEEIDRGRVKNKKVFENELIPSIGKDISKGEYSLSKINGFFKIDSEYYRWDINFFEIMMTLLVTAVVLIFTSIKIAKLTFELAFSKFFAIIGAMGDITYGQKTKQILQHIFSIYITIFSTGLALHLYILGSGWIGSKLTGFPKIIVLIGAGMFVMDGPNLIEKLYGMDAGMSQGTRFIVGLNSALDMAGKVGKGAKGLANVGKDVLGKAGIGAAGLAGFAVGNKFDNLDNQMDSNKVDSSNFIANNGNQKALEDEMKDSPIDENKDNIKNEDFEMKENNLDDNKDNVSEEANSELSGINNMSSLEDEIRESENDASSEKLEDGNKSLSDNEKLSYLSKDRNSINSLENEMGGVGAELSSEKINDSKNNLSNNETLNDGLVKDIINGDSLEGEMEGHKNEGLNNNIDSSNEKITGNEKLNDNQSNDITTVDSLEDELKEFENGGINENIEGENNRLENDESSDNNLQSNINSLEDDVEGFENNKLREGATSNEGINNNLSDAMNNINSLEEKDNNFENNKSNESLSDSMLNDDGSNNIGDMSSLENDIKEKKPALNTNGNLSSSNLESEINNKDLNNNRNLGYGKSNSIENKIAGNNDLYKAESLEGDLDKSNIIRDNGNSNLNTPNITRDNGNSNLNTPNIDSFNSGTDIIKNNNISNNNSNDTKNGVMPNNTLRSTSDTNWTYGESSSATNDNTSSNVRDDDYNSLIDYSMILRNQQEDKYIDPDERRNIKDILSSATKNKVESMKNSDFVNNAKLSYKVGNNTSRDLNKYVGKAKDKAINKAIEKQMKRGRK